MTARSELAEQAAEAQRRWNARAQITAGGLTERWLDEAAILDARASQARAAGEGGRFQIHAWETRASALRDCAGGLLSLTSEDES